MLQPRRVQLRPKVGLILAVVFVGAVLASEDIHTSPRRRRQDGNDVTTVLLVDSHGRSSFGRYQNVKPDIGLITSTARTFIQEGVTTEYATQVLGTTLDNGRLYAHLLTKSSRVLYDHAPNSKEPNKKWKQDLVIKSDQPMLVFPTVQPHNYIQQEEELLDEEPSNNLRVPYLEPQNNNIKIFKITPQHKDLNENLIISKDLTLPKQQKVNASKVKQWDDLPTFTVRNEFSPSGFSYLGDFPEFDSATEKSKTSAADRKAKLLYRAGLVKPELRDLHTTTYTGFADFTTTVGDTVIVFSPHTAEAKPEPGEVTKISVEATINPTSILPSIGTSIKTFFSQEPGMETQTVEGHKLDMKTTLPTMVIDKNDRQRRPKENEQQFEDMDAKSAVLAHEQSGESTDGSFISTSSGRSTIIFTPDLIEPSESQTPMLSTPSDEDIAKIFASLQAQAAKPTEPLNTPSTIFLDETSILSKPNTEISTGATTIFFEDDLPIQNTAVFEPPRGTTEEITTAETTTLDDKETTTREATTKETTTKEATTREAVAKETTTQRETTTHRETTTTQRETTPKETTPRETTTQKETTTQRETTTHRDTTTQRETTTQSETTTHREPTTTNEIETTTSEEKTLPPPVDDDEVDVACTSGTQILPTTDYKTLTYLTTFFIPQDNDETTTSVKSNVVTSTEIGFATKSCEATIAPSAVKPVELKTITTTEPDTTTQELTTTEQVTTEDATTEAESTPALETTPQITTERRHVTESEPETTEATTESGEEIELIFKTLYTTYTYLTTYFHESTSSIESKILVTTNVITSTLVPGSEASDSAVAGLFDKEVPSRTISFDDIEIEPTKIADDSSEVRPTPALNPSGVKTYYTTYTYFTTIFVDGESEISSRTEVYTNYVTPSIQATVALEDIVPTRLPPASLIDKNQLETPSLEFKVSPVNQYSSTISRTYSDKVENNIIASGAKEQNYVTLQRTTEDSVAENNNLEYETIATMVTDVRSSTSSGDRRIIDNVDKRNVLDDQIVSESNNDSEIIPSPTLLLQTSYTTFTYFTTMYHGTTSSNVVSRLETVTNVVTETLTPTHTLSVEDLSLPITYFTTFTYWTTLYKDGVTKVTSREETVSNVVTPTPSLSNALPTISITPVVSTSKVSSSSATPSIQPSTVGEDDLTTYYTTYTYYTTSYVGDSAVVKSRLETVTNVINNTDDASNQIGRAIGSSNSNQIQDGGVKTSIVTATAPVIKPTGLLSTVVNTVENSGTKTVLSTDVYGTYIDGLYAKVLESSSSIIAPIAPSSVSENIKPTGVVSINHGKIVDAEGISTLFYTTQAVGTYIDNLYAQVIESTSSLKVNEERKAALATDVPINHKTGLVRLIEGSIVQNDTTTLYQSKVLGTVIDGRYAQIIESTSSFLVGKASSIAPTATKAPSITATATPISPSPVVIESSLSDSSKVDEETTTEEFDEEDEENGSRTKSRLTFQSRKRTFTPVIRPFASRGRPTFAPKRKGAQGTATTVTRSDVTPTVTAVPASKARFGTGRRSSSSSNAIVPTASGSRRFSRPKSSSAVNQSSRRSSARIQPTASSSRRVGFRTSSSRTGSSSLYSGNSRFRIRPSASIRATASTTPSDEENDLTTIVTDNPTDSGDEANETTLAISTTTEGSSRRSQNPLLRFRRPPLARTPVARTTPKPRKSTTTKATTAKPTARNRPVNSRTRSNGLFPRRNLFTTTTTPAPEEEEEFDEELDENIEDDTDYESSQTNTQTAKPERRGRSSRVIKRRTKRDTTYSRFRRPTARTSTTEEPEVTEKSRPTSRFRSRTKTTSGTTSAPVTRKRISPSKPQARSQFTLREKNTTPHSSYRRPSTTSRARTNTRPKSPRLRNTKPTTRASRGRARTTHTRQRTEIEDNYVLPRFDGTITVTHHIPTEVTIPVVSGKITEYKNVITAKYSTETLDPAQYSTSLNAFGKDVTVLLSEATSIGDNGATLITQFVLNETPTTSVVFTPTHIRGRKTSFSHVIPSTAYGVEQVVNTIQPALAAQAPLANILLSQLLLGGIQPQNPLLALQNQGFGQAATPATEFKTRVTTYVTTVTNVQSTVIPLTFRGKEILTTIIDSSVNVVTATEFLTDTIVVTPTALPGFQAAAANNQLNTLLLPLLQQQLAQQQQQQAPAGVISISTDRPQAQALFQEPEKFNLALEDDETSQELDQIIEPVTQASKRKQRKPRPKPKPTEPPKETSVITLYVSGRTPGEFSTVLSTVVVGENDRRKRDLKPSKSYNDDLTISTLDYYDTYVMPASKDLVDTAGETVETESLESIIGDVSKYISTQELKPTKTAGQASKKYFKASSKAPSGNFLA